MRKNLSLNHITIKLTKKLPQLSFLGHLFTFKKCYYFPNTTKTQLNTPFEKINTFHVAHTYKQLIETLQDFPQWDIE